MIIACDGVDGSGKSTMSCLIRDYIDIDMQKEFPNAPKRNVIHVQQPGGTPMGKELRKIVKDKRYDIHPMAERMIFAADNIQTLATVISPEHKSDSIVVCDRYSLVTDIVYGMAAGTSLETIGNVQKVLSPLFVQADVFILMRCSLETALSRKSNRSSGDDNKECRIEAKGQEFMEKVIKLYDVIGGARGVIAEEDDFYNMQRRHYKRIHVVDANRSMNEVRATVMQIVKHELGLA